MDKLISALSEEFSEIKVGRIHAESELMELLGWSSLNIVIVRAKVQETFGVKLSDQQIKSCKTVADLHSIISLLNNR
jgi:acyl carrier protein